MFKLLKQEEHEKRELLLKKVKSSLSLQKLQQF